MTEKNLTNYSHLVGLAKGKSADDDEEMKKIKKMDDDQEVIEDEDIKKSKATKEDDVDDTIDESDNDNDEDEDDSDDEDVDAKKGKKSKKAKSLTPNQIRTAERARCAAILAAASPATIAAAAKIAFETNLDAATAIGIVGTLVASVPAAAPAKKSLADKMASVPNHNVGVDAPEKSEKQTMIEKMSAIANAKNVGGN